jgi:hypothetical protein
LSFFALQNSLIGDQDVTNSDSSFASKIVIHPWKLLQSRRGVTQLGEPGKMMTDHGFSLLLL